MATENMYKKGDWVRAKDAYVADHWNRYWADKSGVTATADTVFKVYDGDQPDNSITIGAGKLDNGPTWYASRFEPWQPKVGERVRVKEGANSQWAGEGEVVRVPEWCVIIKMLSGGMKGQEGGFYAHQIEPITDTLPVAEQPAARENAGGGFKAGDKIELVSGALANIRVIGDVYEAVAHKKPADSRSVCFIGNDGEVTWAPGEYFKLHEPLRIAAGKFYKTRDGRKVGPVKARANYFVADGWHYNKHGECGMDGVHSPYEEWRDRHDLIAEWVDTPVRDITAATVDAINDEYGPVVREVPVPVAQQQAPARVKVGDRVRFGGGMPYILGGDQTAGIIVGRPYPGQRGDWTVNVDNYSGTLTFFDRELSPYQPAIVALIENGQPLPATRPAVHTSAEAADAEAIRLAGVHKGQEFGVFVLTGDTHKEAKVYEHEWQRLAAGGEKAKAINELRKLAGLTIRGAIDAIDAYVDYQSAA